MLPLQKLSQEAGAKAKAKAKSAASKGKAKGKAKAKGRSTKKEEKKSPDTPMKRPSALNRSKSHAGLASTPPTTDAAKEDAESESEAKPRKRPAAAAKVTTDEEDAEPASKKRPAAAKVEGQGRYSLDLFCNEFGGFLNAGKFQNKTLCYQLTSWQTFVWTSSNFVLLCVAGHKVGNPLFYKSSHTYGIKVDGRQQLTVPCFMLMC